MKIVMTCLALSKVVNMFLIIVRALDILSMTSDGDRSLFSLRLTIQRGDEVGRLCSLKVQPEFVEKKFKLI